MHPSAPAFLAVLAASVAPAAGGATAGTSGGLYGRVLISPARPVCLVGEPCTRPASNLRLVFSRRGHVLARAKTRADGSYRAALPPGRYAVATPGAPRAGRGLEPRAVTVPRGRHKRVDFTLDVGIR